MMSKTKLLLKIESIRCRRETLCLSMLLLVCSRTAVFSWSPMSSDKTLFSHERRKFNNLGLVIGSSLLTGFVNNIPEAKAVAAASLAERLSLRDPAALTNPVFNIPPKAQVFPPFMRGSWNVTLKYGGYIFPSQTIPRSQLTKNPQIPGFQKCSIAALSDVGKETVHYTLNIDDTTGLEDRKTSLMTSIDDHLGYSAVQDVLYNPGKPNRVSVVFVGYKTTNAERIELFCNGRESEVITPEQQQQSNNNNNIFVSSEFMKQVTFGTGSEVGIPRQVGTNYAHFWTWKENDTKDTMTGNLLTASYLDPQDAMFFQEPSKPVAVFSHVIQAEKVRI